MLVVAIAYVVIGVGFAALDDSPVAGVVRFWRLAAWVASAVVAVAQIAYEHYRLRNSPRTTALHAAGAVALGALGLALAANLHAWRAGMPARPLLLIALVAWPVITAVPAFVAAWMFAAVLDRISPRV